jgi:cAMP-dependent protein kinase regulator
MSDSDDSDSDSDESMDEEDESEPLPPVASRPQKRRASICAEKLCPDKIGSEQVKKIPKSEEELSKIRDILLKCVLFEHLCDDQLLAVKEAMFPMSKEEDAVIIKQGDDGDNFYIIESGSVDVYINRSDEEPSKLVNSYSDGDSFGELAIMYNAPRAATCIARGGPVKMWALDRSSFKIILMKAAISKRKLYKTFLREVPILSEMTEHEILTIADALHEDTFDDGTIICEEGASGDRFYIIKQGSVICKKTFGDGNSEEVACLNTGSYFGEVSPILYAGDCVFKMCQGDLRRAI